MVENDLGSVFLFHMFHCDAKRSLNTSDVQGNPFCVDESVQKKPTAGGGGFDLIRGYLDVLMAKTH